MKWTCDSHDIKLVLDRIDEILENDMSEHAFLSLEVTDGRLTLAAAHKAEAISVTLPVDSARSGICRVHAHTLREVVRLLEKQELSFEWFPRKNRLAWQGTASLGEIAGLESAPTSPRPVNEFRATVTALASDLADGLKSLRFAVLEATHRLASTPCLNVSWSPSCLTIEATDNRVYCKAVMDGYTNDKFRASAVLSTTSFQRFENILTKNVPPGEVELQFSDTWIGLSAGPLHYQAVLQQGKFPDYSSLRLSEDVAEWEVQCGPLSKAAALASLFGGNTKRINFKTGSALVIESSGDEHGMSQVQLPIRGSPAEDAIPLNGMLLSHIAGAPPVATAWLRVGCNGSEGPLIFSAKKDPPSTLRLTYVLMPMS
jgi:DNA polymerase III sliding clamp (beta) subunit (PCNA family)